MRKKLALLTILVLITGLFIACGTAPEVEPELQDNGKNLGWIDTSNLTKTMTLLQRWIDEHPDKRIVAISSDSTTSKYGGQRGWLFVYEDRK